MQVVGKYRAFVVDIKDPEKRGRIKVKCPAIFGEFISNWCEPCIIGAVDLTGDFYIPPINETVWIEFENGNVNKPIYTGSWYSVDKTPISDYTKVSNYRIIGFKGVQIILSENEVSIKVGDNVLNLNADSISKLNTLVENCDSIISHISQ